MSAAAHTAPLSNPVAEAAIIAGLVRCGDPAAIGRYALDHRLALDCFTLPAYRNAYAEITDLPPLARWWTYPFCRAAGRGRPRRRRFRVSGA
ncbi:MAG: hypothetical protein IPK63_19585, partial [Candidatus Competibacteraceae bacterium]|nr:hypothetical protein [Candidatus Competibacteraceae bacterium]